MIKLKLKNGVLSIVQNQINTSASINYFKIKIDFEDEGWENLEKHATFYHNVQGDRYDVVISESGIVTVPYKILETCLPYFVGVYGISENMRATSNNVKISVIEGAYKPKMIMSDGSFEKAEVVAPNGKSIPLEGIYDGTPVSITTNENVNIEELLKSKRLPLSVDLNLPVYNGDTEIKIINKDQLKNGININTQNTYVPFDINISINQSLLPQGQTTIDKNGEYDVELYETAKVNVLSIVEISSATEMDNLLTNYTIADLNKVYLYTGTTTNKYTQGIYYLLEE